MGEAQVVFSGDLGRRAHPLLRPPADPPEADSAGGRVDVRRPAHPPPDPDLLADAICRTIERGGSLLLPAFAVDRTELVLLELRRLMGEGRDPRGADLRGQPDGAGRARGLPASRRARLGRAAAGGPRPHGRPRRRRPRRARRGGVDAAQPARRAPASSSPPRAWRPEAASCTTWPTSCPTAATPSCSPATRRPAPAVASSPREPGRSRSTVATCPCARRSSASRTSPCTPTRTRPSSGSPGRPRPPRTVYVVHGEPEASAALASRGPPRSRRPDLRRARLDRGRAVLPRARAGRLRTPEPQTAPAGRGDQAG